MLSNEKFIGNVILGKTFSDDFPNNNRHINRSEREKYLLTASHPAIISEELFERVQSEKLRRSNILLNENGKKRKDTHYSMKKDRRVKD